MPYLTDEEYEELESDAKQKAQVEKLWKRDAEHLLEVGIKNEKLTARVKELEEAKDRLEKAAFQAVAHVAAANYPEREQEAYNMLYTALRGEA